MTQKVRPAFGGRRRAGARGVRAEPRSRARVSTPGRRVYRKATDLRPVLNGMGISIISTSGGVVSDREARQKNLGGEVLAELY